MKSMLHEASSIIKAVEKAWTESGKPSEFTIKILEKGEKNFIGMTTRPAIVSITYGFVSEKPKDFNVNKRFNRPQVPSQDLPKPAFAPRPNLSKENVKNIQVKLKQPQKSVVPELQQKKEIVQQDLDIQVWDSELVNFCIDNLRQLFSALGFNSDCSTKINNRLLTVVLNKQIAVNEPDLRPVYASISHLLLQFLKKKYKKKFNGFQIIINSTSSNELHNPNKFN